jgi:hypothetical protein
MILDEGFAPRISVAVRGNLPSSAEVEACKQWLLKYAKKKRLPEGRRLNSDYLKHLVEDTFGQHVTNGAFIQAAIDLGFEYSTIDGPNAFFHIDLRLPEDEWKRVKPIGFSKWLFKQEDSLLAQDAKADPTWPRQAKRFIDFWRYLDRHYSRSEQDEDDLSEAWKTWTGKAPPRPAWINTSVVYNRECDFISYGDPYPVALEGSTYLYALVEIDEQYDLVHVRYVGQAISPSKRLNDLIKRPGSIDRVKWIDQMLHKDKYPQMAIFSSGVALSMANSLEKAAIYAFQECETRWDDELDDFPPLDDALLNIDK